MACHSLRWLVLMLAFSCVISAYAVPMSRISRLQYENKDVEPFNSKNQDQVIPEVKIDSADIEKNDYGPTTSNPIHTPKPPRS